MPVYALGPRVEPTREQPTKELLPTFVRIFSFILLTIKQALPYYVHTVMTNLIKWSGDMQIMAL